MGKRARRRQREGTQAPPTSASASATYERSAAEVGRAVAEAAAAYRDGLPHRAVPRVRQLASWWTPGAVASPQAHAVPAIVRGQLEVAVATCWRQGWQPADLHRAIWRNVGALPARLLSDVIAAQACSYRGAPHSDGRWLRQLDVIEADTWWPEGAEQLECWASRERLDATDVLDYALELLGQLWALPVLPRLCPPPHEWGPPPPGSGRRRSAGSSAIPAAGAEGVDVKILDRIRALLSKAESTDYAPEAEALTSKAQQMMTRHSIDHAMLAPAAQGDPMGRRLGVEDPYAGSKVMLLDRVARASRCRTVWTSNLGFSTVFGFPADLDAVELLYTSLLVQATGAMLAAGHGGPAYRSRTFRQSFLTGFATRIGQRLEESAQQSVGEARAEHGDALLPVLAARSQAVDQAVETTFPELRSRTVRIRDGAGWAAGTSAADLASLARGAALAGSRSA